MIGLEVNSQYYDPSLLSIFIAPFAFVHYIKRKRRSLRFHKTVCKTLLWARPFIFAVREGGGVPKLNNGRMINSPKMLPTGRDKTVTIFGSEKILLFTKILFKSICFKFSDFIHFDSLKCCRFSVFFYIQNVSDFQFFLIFRSEMVSFSDFIYFDTLKYFTFSDFLCF